MRHIVVFDTTLRDGEKAPGTILTVREKIRIAKNLERLGVDVIEAGFPAASPEQFEAVQRIAKDIREVTVAALARATNPKDFEIAWEALQSAKHPRLHTFVPVSSYYRDHFLKRSAEETLELAVSAVKMAGQYTADIEFSLVDALRANIDDAVQLIAAVIEAGAKTINIADTVGYATPGEMSRLFQVFKERIDSFDQVVFSVHCHNDLGLAVANSLAAVEHGACQVHCTINGIGERAGNTSLEEIAVLLAARTDQFEARTGIKLDQIYPASRLVRRLTGINIQANKPIVGDNVFVFDQMVPQLGDETEPPPYKIVDPQELGIDSSGDELNHTTSFQEFCERAADLGFDLPEQDLQQCYDEFKKLVVQGETLSDTDLELLLTEKAEQGMVRYKLLYLNVSAGSISVPNATVQMEVNGEIVQDAGFGRGPVDAAFKTIFKMVQRSPKLLRYEVNAVTAGTEAQGEVCVHLEENGQMVHGRAVDTDIVLASAKALIDGLNKLEHTRAHPPVSEFTDEDSWIPKL